MNPKRREFLISSLLGVSALGLRSLATGLPISVLADPLRADAQMADSGAGILILNTSAAGEPINCNAPGTYRAGLNGIVHPGSGALSPTSVTLGGQTHTAAKTWADLGQSILDRTVCIHHGTYTGIHARQTKVMRLMGSTNRGEMMVSLLAKNTASRLQTTQMEPLSLGAKAGQELLSFDGRTLSNVAPTSLKRVLGAPEGPLGQLQALRDKDLDRIHALYRMHGSKNQRRMLDRFATAQSDVRSISTTLLDRLTAIADDDAGSQVLAAPVLAAMRLSPVITIHIPFGGDNHFDNLLGTESAEHVSGFGLMKTLVESLDTLRSQNVLTVPATVATLGVFGRTLGGNGTGRAHNSRHHVTVLIGDRVRAGVIGGVEPYGDDFGASGFDAATGERVPIDSSTGTHVPFEQTLESTAKTIGAALGVPSDYLDQEITGGRVITAALR